jgi:hypothetical protein
MISKLLPRSVRRRIQNVIMKSFKIKGGEELYHEHLAKRRQIEQLIPKISLEEKHITNTRVLLDRCELLKLLPKNSVCAEIGVDRGEFTSEILKLTHPRKIHLIDLWGDSQRYHDGLKLAVQQKFEAQINEGLIKVDVGYSIDVLSNFPDKYFDWVYLDTDHTYQTTSKELTLLEKKVVEGGIIAGHDFTLGNWVGDFRYGVIEAVHEFCVRENWEIIFLTMEVHQFRSFAIRKI